MEFTIDFITEQKFTPEQVTAINGVIGDAQDAIGIAELKKGWDDTATTNAEAIIDGAITATQATNNFTLERKQGEKLGEWQGRYSKALNESRQTTLDASILEYDTKVKDFKGDADLKAQIIVLEGKLDPLQKKEAEYVTLLSSGVPEKYEALLASNKENLRALSFGSAKPVFHVDANEFEVSAKWNNFISTIESTHDVVMVDKEAIAILKTNEHIRTPLKDLVAKDEDLTKLINGREQKGIKGEQVDVTTITNVPFGVPKDVSSKDLTALIHKQLATEGLEQIGHTAAEYSKRFRELNELARGKKTSDK